MNSFLNRISEREPFAQLREFLNNQSLTLDLGHFPPGLAAVISAASQAHINGLVMLVTPGPAPAESMVADLTALVGSDLVALLPPLRTHSFETAPLASGPRNERTEALLKMHSGIPGIIVTQPEALLEAAPTADWLRRQRLLLRVGDNYPRELLLSNLVEAGYAREALVDSQGQYAVRGGLLDIFPLGLELPVRIEFFGDEIASLRSFDPSNQRSKKKIDQMVILIGDENASDAGSVFDLLANDSVVIWNDVFEIERRLDQVHQRYQKAISQGITSNTLGEPLAGLSDLIEHASGKRQLFTGTGASKEVAIEFKARRPDPFASGLDELTSYLQHYINHKLEVWISAENKADCERIDELLSEMDIEGVATFFPSLTSGFVAQECGIVLLTAHELLGRRRIPGRAARFRRKSVAFDRNSLRSGDLVVHATYGIGKFEGMQTIKVRGEPMEALRIRYQDDVVLFVRVEHFGLVEKYVGSEGTKPSVSKIGTGEWSRTKKKTKKALKDMAGELIKLYAERKIAPGTQFSEDTHWQHEMEESFEFVDTPDQARASMEVKADLESENPMDRLLSGDVGFGKTEVAIRAAFKVVQDSHQVAVLVPTTILAQQHYETFKERLSSYPVRVETLSRFVPPADQKQIVADMKAGKVDIVIGTHRIISQDIGFKRLGLVVIDEEHRFGVRHKERLKQLKANVDVLTMTATPIPRTLHMALMGARDTSQINTPPIDRLPIITETHSFDEDIIRDAILLEADRKGQVFFLHNRVESIYAVKGMLERLAPGLRYGIGHGQMPEHELEQVMIDFMENRIDVLICTTIIESGIDIPNANTLIVNRADKFGLAQLYQIRGRIGRSSRQAYAYLLTPPRIEMTPDARRRLATLAELTELGSGMKIALRDLEIRGAGNLLGAEQSGFINAVGFDLYTKLLEEAVQEIKGAPVSEEITPENDVQIDFPGAALLPVDYIDDGDLRYDFYRRLASSTSMDELESMREELNDRFGTPPVEARNLIDSLRLKIMCRRLSFRHLRITDKYLTAVLQMPSDPAEAQSYIGKLVAVADPEPIEFRSAKHVELLYRYPLGDSLRQACRFLQRLTREGIFQV